MSQCRLSLQGEVQGVGLRSATMRKAEELGIKGWIMNKKDGTVEVVLAGEKETVLQMIQWYTSGSGKRLTITVAKKVWEEKESKFQDFTIRFEQ